MQLYGIEKGRKVCASKAERSQTYLCQECLEPLELHPETPAFASHFTHRKSHPLCIQNKKSIHHLLAQMKINSLVSENEIIIENFYPETGWCADLVWLPYKLVFILSPHTSQTAIEKALSTCKQNMLTPIWLIEEKAFPKRLPKPLLQKLYSQTRYFYQVSKAEKIKLYDRIVLESPKYIGNPVRVDLTLPTFEGGIFKGFHGDIYHLTHLLHKNLELNFPESKRNLSLKKWASFFLDALLCKSKNP